MAVQRGPGFRLVENDSEEATAASSHPPGQLPLFRCLRGGNAEEHTCPWGTTNYSC